MKKSQNPSAQLPLIVITGPTASGKTALAINLAKKIGAEIISADSRCVYRGLDIVSAKPSIDERNSVVHHLIDIKEPLDEPYSAGDFAFDASAAIEKIRAKNKPVIIAGGTWFYIKCLLGGEKLPEIPVNKKYRKELETFNNAELWEMLKEVDEKRAVQIHKNNRERVIRALEMARALNSPVSEAAREPSQYASFWFSTDFTDDNKKDELYRRINFRVDKMIEDSLYYEWERMKAKFGRTKVLENTIGYKEFFDLEDGLYPDIKSAVSKIKQSTRNFAKRQNTFFRQEEKIVKVKDEDEILSFVKQKIQNLTL